LILKHGTGGAFTRIFQDAFLASSLNKNRGAGAGNK
jgi:hypothetical protein